MLESDLAEIKSRQLDFSNEKKYTIHCHKDVGAVSGIREGARSGDA